MPSVVKEEAEIEDTPIIPYTDGPGYSVIHRG